MLVFFNWRCVKVQLCPSVIHSIVAHAIKVKSNLMHPLSISFLLLYVPARVSHGTLVSLLHSFTPPRCTISQYRRTFVFLSVSVWNHLHYHVFDG